MPLVIAAFMSIIECLIIEFLLKPKKYQLIWIIFIAKLIPFILFIIVFTKGNSLRDKIYSIFIIISLALLFSIIEYFLVRFIRNRKSIKKNEFVLLVFLVNWITYSAIFILCLLILMVAASND